MALVWVGSSATPLGSLGLVAALSAAVPKHRSSDWGRHPQQPDRREPVPVSHREEHWLWSSSAEEDSHHRPVSDMIASDSRSLFTSLMAPFMGGRSRPRKGNRGREKPRSPLKWRHALSNNPARFPPSQPVSYHPQGVFPQPAHDELPHSPPGFPRRRPQPNIHQQERHSLHDSNSISSPHFDPSEFSRPRPEDVLYVEFQDSGGQNFRNNHHNGSFIEFSRVVQPEISLATHFKPPPELTNEDNFASTYSSTEAVDIDDFLKPPQVNDISPFKPSQPFNPYNDDFFITGDLFGFRSEEGEGKILSELPESHHEPTQHRDSPHQLFSSFVTPLTQSNLQHTTSAPFSFFDETITPFALLQDQHNLTFPATASSQPQNNQQLKASSEDLQQSPPPPPPPQLVNNSPSPSPLSPQNQPSPPPPHHDQHPTLITRPQIPSFPSQIKEQFPPAPVKLTAQTPSSPPLNPQPPLPSPTSPTHQSDPPFQPHSPSPTPTPQTVPTKASSTPSPAPLLLPTPVGARVPEQEEFLPTTKESPEKKTGSQSDPDQPSHSKRQVISHRPEFRPNPSVEVRAIDASLAQDQNQLPGTSSEPLLGFSQDDIGPPGATSSGFLPFESSEEFFSHVFDGKSPFGEKISSQNTNKGSTASDLPQERLRPRPQIGDQPLTPESSRPLRAPQTSSLHGTPALLSRPSIQTLEYTTSFTATLRPSLHHNSPSPDTDSFTWNSRPGATSGNPQSASILMQHPVNQQQQQQQQEFKPQPQEFSHQPPGFIQQPGEPNWQSLKSNEQSQQSVHQSQLADNEESEFKPESPQFNSRPSQSTVQQPNNLKAQVFGQQAFVVNHPLPGFSSAPQVPARASAPLASVSSERVTQDLNSHLPPDITKIPSVDGHWGTFSDSQGTDDSKVAVTGPVGSTSIPQVQEESTVGFFRSPEPFTAAEASANPYHPTLVPQVSSVDIVVLPYEDVSDKKDQDTSSSITDILDKPPAIGQPVQTEEALSSEEEEEEVSVYLVRRSRPSTGWTNLPESSSLQPGLAASSTQQTVTVTTAQDHQGARSENVSGLLAGEEALQFGGFPVPAPEPPHQSSREESEQQGDQDVPLPSVPSSGLASQERGEDKGRELPLDHRDNTFRLSTSKENQPQGVVEQVDVLNTEPFHKTSQESEALPLVSQESSKSFLGSGEEYKDFIQVLGSLAPPPSSLCQHGFCQDDLVQLNK